ncbi:MAG: HAD family hydrolase [Pseudomonadota bacterium]
MIDQYKAVIFDWDGTIVDTCGLILDAHNHVRKHFDKPLWTMEDFLGRASESAREYYPKVYGDRAEEAQEVLYDYVEAHHLNYLEPMADSENLLNEIKQLGLPMAIVSNKRHKTLGIEIEHVGYQDYFDFVIGAGVAKRDKPSADPILDAMAALNHNLKPEEVLYVGDTETDLLAAQNAKLPVVFIQSDAPRPDLIEKYAPNYNYLSISEFLNAFFDKNSQKTALSG